MGLSASCGPCSQGCRLHSGLHVAAHRQHSQPASPPPSPPGRPHPDASRQVVVPRPLLLVRGLRPGGQRAAQRAHAPPAPVRAWVAGVRLAAGGRGEGGRGRAGGGGGGGWGAGRGRGRTRVVQPSPQAVLGPLVPPLHAHPQAVCTPPLPPASQVFSVFSARLEADRLAFSAPADMDSLDACAQQLAQASRKLTRTKLVEHKATGVLSLVAAAKPACLPACLSARSALVCTAPTNACVPCSDARACRFWWGTWCSRAPTPRCRGWRTACWPYCWTRSRRCSTSERCAGAHACRVALASAACCGSDRAACLFSLP